MTVNRRQHFVSQFTIRAFMGGRDRLYCLDKATLTVPDRIHGNKPADILNKAYYYTTDTDDFDGEVVQPLENKLAPLCRGWVEDPDRPLTLDEMALLVDWCALSLTRSIYFAHVASVAYETLSDEDKADLPADGKAMTLVARRATFNRIRQEFRKVKLMFRFLKSPRRFGFYLTDYPPVPIPYRRVGAIGPLLLPMSHDLMLVEVPADLADAFYGELKPTPEWLTLVQCGWAQRLIYSADLKSLDVAASVLSTERNGRNTEMAQRARLPFFGFGEPCELASMWPESPTLPQ